MSEQIQRHEVGFSLLSDLLKVFQTTTRTELLYEPPQFNLDLELKTLQIRVNALNSLRNRIEERIPELYRIAGFVNSIAPNPITKNVLIVVGTAHAILTTIISSYDIINGNGDALDAILDIVASVAELLPLTGASNARDIKRTMQSGCRAVSSIRRAVQPIKNNPSTIDMIHKLSDIERSFLDCQAFANRFL